MQTKQKSVSFASQTEEHAIPRSTTSIYRTLEIEDETQKGDSKLIISEKSMKRLQDCSKMRVDKQLSKLAKDGVIFLKAPSNNSLRTNAIKLRNVLIKLLAKYQFTEKVPHPKYDTSVNKQIISKNYIRTKFK